MALLGRLGCTITKQFVWGIEVTNISRTFRGTVTNSKSNGIVIRINGDKTNWTGTVKSAIRHLRKRASQSYSRSVVLRIDGKIVPQRHRRPTQV